MLDEQGQTLYGIRVNWVHPGFIRTVMTKAAQPDTSGIALGWVGESDEVAKPVVFLASDDSSFSTGAEFVIDGETARNTTVGPEPSRQSATPRFVVAG